MAASKSCCAPGRSGSTASAPRPATLSRRARRSGCRRCPTRRARRRVGLPELRQGRIDLALAKSGGAGRERVHADDAEGKAAVTYYRVVDHAGDKASWLALLPVTGRTHQLRAHRAVLGTPILGDGKYGGSGAQLAGGAGVQRLHLHARSLEIPLPGGGTLRVTAPLPPHMRKTWEFFGFEGDAPDPFPESDGGA